MICRYNYSVLLLSKSEEVSTKLNIITEDIQVKSFKFPLIMDALDCLMDEKIDIFVIDTSIELENLYKFLEYINEDYENNNTPIIILSQNKDYDELSSLVSEYNVIATLSNSNWEIQTRKLLTLLREHKTSLDLLKDDLSQSEERSVIDPLTGTYNRYGAEDIFNKLTARVKAYDENFCAIMMDIDHFKNVNDTYGHDIGDEVLKGFCNLVSMFIRKDDALIRLGGEEFIIFISKIDINIAIKNAQKIREAISGTLHSSKHLDITSSFGVVQYIPNEELDSLIKRADELLYEAKKQGRNRVVSIKN